MCVHSGLKLTVAGFLIFTLTVTLVAYTATALTMAISADQSVVALANVFMTITFVFMMVRDAATQTNTDRGMCILGKRFVLTICISLGV